MVLCREMWQLTAGTPCVAVRASCFWRFGGLLLLGWYRLRPLEWVRVLDHRFLLFLDCWRLAFQVELFRIVVCG